jgi:hypothetical protein
MNNSCELKARLLHLIVNKEAYIDFVLDECKKLMLVAAGATTSKCFGNLSIHDTMNITNTTS